MTELSREEFVSHMQLLRADIRAIHDRLDVLNNRTGQAEKAVAVLEDRASQERHRAVAWGAASGAIAAVLMTLMEGAKWLWENGPTSR